MRESIDALARILDKSPYTGSLEVSKQIVHFTCMSNSDKRLKEPFSLSEDHDPVTVSPSTDSIWRDRYSHKRNNLLVYGIREGTTKGALFGTNSAQVFSLICHPGAYNDGFAGGIEYAHNMRNGMGKAHIALDFHITDSQANDISRALRKDPSILNEILVEHEGVSFGEESLDYKLNLYEGFMIRCKAFSLKDARKLVSGNRRLEAEGFPVFKPVKI